MYPLLSIMLTAITTLTFGEGDVGGGDVGGGDVGGGDVGGGDVGGGEQTSFWDSWDGKSESVPNEHRGAFDAITKAREADQGDTLRRGLVEKLRASRRQQSPQRQQAPQRKAERSGEQQFLTREGADRYFAEKSAQEAKAQRISNFRSGMEDVVGKVNQYGEASVSFNSEEEVTAFESYMNEMFSGGITASDMLKLYRFDQILKAHGDARVRGLEKKLGGRNESIRAGANIDPNARRREAPAGGEQRGVASLEDFLKSENPKAYNAITKGEIDILDAL